MSWGQAAWVALSMALGGLAMWVQVRSWRRFSRSYDARRLEIAQMERERQIERAFNRRLSEALAGLSVDTDPMARELSTPHQIATFAVAEAIAALPDADEPERGAR